MSSQPKILIVDDRRQNLIAMEALLDDSNATTIFASSGNEALSLMLKHEFALVLLDVQMPDMDGYEVAELMRANARTENIPIIFVSAINKKDKHIFKGYNSGGVDFLSKPIVPVILKNKVNVFLSLWQQSFELKSALAEVKKRSEELAAVNKEMETFSFSVAHDLRAPLRAIDGFSKILVDNYSEKFDDEGKTYLAYLREGSQDMERLVDGLLMLSRVVRSELSCERVNLSRLATQTMRNLKEDDPERNVNVDIAPDIIVNGDRWLLRVVLENLLGNAWKYTRNKDEAHIVFDAERSNDKLRCSVRDNGAGFDMAYKNKLFAPFQRLHGADEFEGDGIGLSTVQRAINRHGGTVAATGAVGEGATFMFELNI